MEAGLVGGCSAQRRDDSGGGGLVVGWDGVEGRGVGLIKRGEREKLHKSSLVSRWTNFKNVHPSLH